MDLFENTTRYWFGLGMFGTSVIMGTRYAFNDIKLGIRYACNIEEKGD